MKELIKRILQNLGKPCTDEDVAAAEEQIRNGGYDTEFGIIEPIAHHFDMDVEEVERISMPDTPEITDDPEQTMRTLEELTEPREGRPWIATTNRISRSKDQQRTTVVINTTDEDRHGTVIDPEGGSLENYRKNPVFLINHSYGLPAGNNSKVRLQNGQIIAEVSDEDWNDDESTEKGREIKFWKGLVKQGKVKMASVGIMPLEIKREKIEDPKTGDMVEQVIISKWELLEWSFVPVGSNPEALVLQRNMSIAGHDPTEIVRRVKELEDAISEIREFKDSMKNIEVLLSSEQIQRALQQNKEFKDRIGDDGGRSQRTEDSPEGSSDDETSSEDRSVPYVKPPKTNKTVKYIPKPKKVKSPDEVARSVHQLIKQKQGKR